MKKLAAIAFLIAAVLLCACTVANNAETTQPSTESEQAQAETPVPEPTPIPELTNIELPVDIPLNSRILNDTETEGVYSVALPADEENRTNLPTYIWYINGNYADAIDEVVLEFDVFDTVRPLDGKYFGYDQAFYIVLHNFDTIPALPPWPVDYISFKRDDIDINVMIRTPELGVDLKKYAVWEGVHVRIAIPYSEFQTATKNLALQFLPGTTFGNLRIYLWGEDGLYADTAEAISQQVEYPERDLMTEVIQPLYPPKNDSSQILPNPAIELGNRIREGCCDVKVVQKGQVVNPDGSVNMPIIFFDLGEYEAQVQGKYAVIPEGIVPAMSSIGAFGGLSEEDELRIVNFVIKEMMNEDGQFYGIYDIEQQKLVATDRRASALPILSELAGHRSFQTSSGGTSRPVTDRILDLITNSIISDEIVRVGDTLYYAPYGIDENGVMDLKLSDFAITSSLFNLLTEYSQDRSRLKERYGCAILLEGVANSLSLILEGQEQNATRLPSSELRVTFSSDGKSYELQPSDTFSINNSYFSIGLMQFASYYCNIDQFAFFTTTFNETIDRNVMRLADVVDGAYNESQVRSIRDIEACYGEMKNAYRIANTLYESWLDVYNFLKIQTNDTIYADGYNVHTGEMVKISGDIIRPFISDVIPLRNRFGTPAVTMNYFLLTGIFNDETMGTESGNVALYNYFMHIERFSFLPVSSPDTYAENGFQIWGFDSLRYAGGCLMPSLVETYPLYYASGTSIYRENWKVFTMRKINQFTEDEVNFLTPDDAFPTFYDHIPAVTIES